MRRIRTAHHGRHNQSSTGGARADQGCGSERRTARRIDAAGARE
jgi:hypothetical protein